MMKKSAITCFAVLYGILVFTASLERFNEWIAQEAVGLGHFVSSQHFLRIAKAEKSETYLQYKKIVERPFVVEAPREAVGIIPTGSMRHIALPFFESHACWNGQRVSLRAPPSQL
jgi:hypothetical protein